MDANYQLALANARMCGMKFSLEECEGETLLGTSIELWNLIGRMPRSIGDEAKTFRVWGLDRSQLNDDECIERSKGAMALRAMEMGLVPLIVDCGFEKGDTLMIIDYSYIESNYTLEDGRKISIDLVDKLSYIK